MTKSPAVFLDRDGTIIEDRNHIAEPDDVRLLPGATGAIRRLSEANYLVIVVSNQSGVARGLFDEETLAEVHGRLEELLAAERAGLDGAYYCPYLDGSEATIEAYRRDSELRKPRPGMLLQAAGELDIDLTRSWMIGDKASDVEAGTRAGCQTILLDGGREPAPSDVHHATHSARDLAGAVDLILRTAGQGDSVKPETDVKTAPAHRDDEVLKMLERIHGQLDRAHRRKRQSDFSLTRFFGVLLEMFAIVAALWGVIALLNDQAPEATARLALGCFLQLASMSTFVMDRFR